MEAEKAHDLDFDKNEPVLDPAIIRVLPTNCVIQAVQAHGTSFWATTGRIDIELCDGELCSFFVKVMSKGRGKDMLHSEYESMSTIHKMLPKLVPRPIGWGEYDEKPETYFIIMEFRDMILDMPDPNHFAFNLARMHQRGTSPNGKFGFHTTTYPGNLPQYTGWEDSWEVFFAKSMRQALDLAIAAHGSIDFEGLDTVLFDTVIPRLLGPLESNGHSLKPSLVHGDLWWANSGIDRQSGQPVIFDACCLYAHNEYEFGQWRPKCNRFGGEYLEAYLKIVPISPPVEDFIGRLDLYKLRFNTHVTALFPEKSELREQMMDDLKDLKDRYGHGQDLRGSKSG